MVRLLPVLLVPAVAFTAYKATTIYTRLTIPYPIALTRSLPASLSNHRIITSIINPDKVPALSDTHEVVIPWPQTSNGQVVSERQILARLCYGFFGETVLTPERIVLGLVRRDLLGIEQLKALPVPQEIWKREELLRNDLLEVGSKVLGTFQVVDRKVAPALASDRNGATPNGEESWITFAYGFDQGLFKGVHRFDISPTIPPASADRQDDHKQWVRVRMSSTNVVTSDSQYVHMAMKWLGSFHLVYADLLFRDAVAAVLDPYV